MPAKLPRLALAADILAGFLLVLASITVFVEGPSLWIGDTRIVSLRSAWRIYLWAAVILAIRAWYVPQPRSFDRFRRFMRSQVNRDEAISTDATRVGWRELAVVTLAYVVFVAALTWPQVVNVYSVPDLGDPLFSIWRISWVSHQILRDPLSLFDTNIFHPERLTLTYSDPVIVPGLMAAPFLRMGMHPLLVYNILLLSGLVFSGVTTYVLVKSLTGQREAAAVAGAIFAVYPFRLEHYPHLELQMTMWMPLVFWGVHRTLALGRWHDALVTGAAFAAQMLSSMYFGVFLAICLVPFGLVLWLGRGRPWRPLVPLAGGVALAGVLLAPVAVKYIESRNTLMGERASEVVAYYSASMSDYLEPHGRNRLYQGWVEGGRAERQLFPRLTPVVLTGVALLPPWTPGRLAYALALFISVNGSLGFNGEVYPTLYEYLAPVRGLRSPGRFSMVAGLMLAILTGYAVARLISRWPRQRLLIGAVLLACVTIEALPNLQLVPVWMEPPPVYGSITDPDAVLAEFPMATDDFGFAFDTRYLYFSTFHWHTMVNGNSGFFPPSHATLISYARHFPSPETLDYLRERRVTHIVVHGAFFGEPRYRTIVETLDGRSDLELVIAAPWEGSESRVYRFR